jgi:tyrosyl-tRNA synthetase
MWRYYDLLSLKTKEEIDLLKLEIEKGENPRNIKVQLGLELVERFYEKIAATNALQQFESLFKFQELPELPLLELTLDKNQLSLRQALKQLNLVESTSEGIRAIEQGGVKINGEKIIDKDFTLSYAHEYIIQVGKRKFAKCIINP